MPTKIAPDNNLSLAVLDKKVDMFMKSQDKHNDNVVKNLEMLTKAMSVQQAQQVEINTLAINHHDLCNKHDSFGVRLGKVESDQAVSAEFRKDAKQLKWISLSAVLALILTTVVNKIYG